MYLDVNIQSVQKEIFWLAGWFGGGGVGLVDGGRRKKGLGWPGRGLASPCSPLGFGWLI